MKQTNTNKSTWGKDFLTEVDDTTGSAALGIDIRPGSYSCVFGKGTTAINEGLGDD